MVALLLNSRLMSEMEFRRAPKRMAASTAYQPPPKKAKDGLISQTFIPTAQKAM